MKSYQKQRLVILTLHYTMTKRNNKFRKQLPGESDEKYAENKLLQKQIKEYIGWFIDRGKFHINYDGNQ